MSRVSLVVTVVISFLIGCSLGASVKVGGDQEAAIENYPFQVLLVKDITENPLLNFCGGVLISPKYVLTAISDVCAVDQTWTAITGTDALPLPSGTNIADIKTIPNQFKLVELKTELTVSSTVKPIDLMTPNTDDKCTVSGWGVEDPSNNPPTTLHSDEIIDTTEDTCTTAQAVYAGDIGGPVSCVAEGSQKVLHSIVAEASTSEANINSFPVTPFDDAAFNEIAGVIDEFSHPFQVLLKGGDKFCGGILVHLEYVLTSLDCVRKHGWEKQSASGRLYRKVVVMAGSLNFDSTLNTKKVKISQVNESKKIALLQLADSFSSEQRTVAAIGYQATDGIPQPTECSISGWDSVPPSFLKHVKVTECGTDETASKSQCTGESNAGYLGGPLTCKSDDKPVLWGVIASESSGSVPKKFDYIPIDSELSAWICGIIDPTSSSCTEGSSSSSTEDSSTSDSSTESTTTTDAAATPIFSVLTLVIALAVNYMRS